MQAIATVDTTEQQAFVWPIRIVDMPTFGASLRGGIGINAHDHAAIQNGFIGQHAVKFGKRPLRIHAVAFALLHRGQTQAPVIYSGVSDVIVQYEDRGRRRW